MNIGKANFGMFLFDEHEPDNGGGGAPAEPTNPTNEPAAPVNEPTEPSGGEPGQPTNEPTSPTSTEDDFENRFQSRLLELAKEKGFEAQSIDDVFKKPEPVEVVKNPYEKVDPKVKAFLDFHTETNRPYEDYLALQQDISAIPDIDLARDRVRQETGNNNLTNAEIDRYLEKKLGVDLSDLEQLEIEDKIELSAFAKTVRESRIAEQEKYKQPIEPITPPSTQKPELEANMVELESGERMPKDVYDKMVATRQKYLEGIKASADNITQSVFKVTIDENGSEKTIDYGYDYSVEDKQNMLSNASDLEATVTKLFKDGQTNELNHKDLVEGMFWLDKNNREKSIAAIIHKVRADVTATLLAEKGNVNFSKEGLPNIPNSNTNKDAANYRQSGGFGVKVPFNNIPKN